MKVLGLIALAFAGLLLSLFLTSCSFGHKSSRTTPTTTTTAVAAPHSPAVPCPSSTGSSSTASTAAATTSSETDATWTGVFERVRVELQNDGSLQKTPHQFTIVSAEASAPVTIDVPVSSSHVHRRSTGKRAHVVNGEAQVELDPKGTTSERLDSDFKRPLPVAVKVTYKLNGKTVSAKDLKGKSGSVEVDYQLTNTTEKPVTVCFKGFNGKLAKQTVPTPAPIIANLSFTIPKHTKSFKAAGAALAPARHGISASWTSSMFEPFGPATQTFVFTMKTKRASVPKATLLLETLDPLSISGKAPADSAAEVAKAQAVAERATAQVQSDVAAIQLKSSQQSSGSKTHEASAKKKHGSRSKKTTRSNSTRSASLNLAVPSADAPGLQAQAAGLQRAHREFSRTMGQSSAALSSADSRSVDELTASTSRSIDALTASATSSVDGLTAGMSRSLAGLKAELRQSVDARSLAAITAKAVFIRRHAGLLRGETSRLERRVHGVVAGLPAPARNALLEVAKLNQLETDLNALGAAEKALPEVQTIVKDVNAAQAVAGTVSGQLSSLEARARGVDGVVRKLQSDTVALQKSVTELQTVAVANARSRIQGNVADVVQRLDARFAAARATAARTIADAKLSAAHTVSSAERSARDSLLSAQRAIASAQRHAERSIASAQREVDRVTASARRALASAKQQAKQGGKTTLAALQADANKAEASAASALAKANDRYARLLTLEQQAVANQLPGGDAAVTVQNGSFLYSIAGI